MTASLRAWLRHWKEREAGGGRRERHAAGKPAPGSRHARERRRRDSRRRGHRSPCALARPCRSTRAILRGPVPARLPEAVALDRGRAPARRAHHVLGRNPRRARARRVSAARARRAPGGRDSDPGARYLGGQHRQRLSRRRRRARPDGLRRRGGAPITARPGDREGRAGRHPLWRRVAGGGGERRAHDPPLPGGRATARDRRGARGPRGSPPRDRAGRRSHRRHPLERAIPHACDGATAVSRPEGFLGKAGVTTVHERRPIHTAYIGAHLFRHGLAAEWGELALRALAEHAPDAPALAAALAAVDDHIDEQLYARVREKLEREPVEDLRIDFEDGFGTRSDQEEDEAARAAGAEVAAGLARRSLPSFLGIRIKPLAAQGAARAARTLELFVTSLVERSGGKLPATFTVTRPKVAMLEEVTALVRLLDGLESRVRLATGALALELMVETPHAILGPDGRCPLPAPVAAAR